MTQCGLCVPQCRAVPFRQGRFNQANCVEATLAHTVWNGTRAAADPEHRKCKRCGGKEYETLKHRYWECEANKKIECDDVRAPTTYARQQEELIGKASGRASGMEASYQPT